MKEQGRPPITFNRVLPVIKAVAGSEVSTRQDIQYLPREVGDAALNEVLTEASRYLADEADAEDEESDAFVDAVICGVGVIEQRLDYEINPDGAYVEDRVNPLEMFWDHTATKRGLSDARRVFRAKTMDRAEAEGLFPDADPSDLDAAWAEDRDGGEPHHQLQPGEHRMDRARRPTPVPTASPSSRCSGGSGRRSPSSSTRRAASRWTWTRPRRRCWSSARRDGHAARAGVPPDEARLPARVPRGDRVGGGPGPAGDRFSYAFLTGDRDQNKGTWFGIVRPMRDPQRFANKWLSQTMDMLNRQSKGGHFAETSAVKDVRQFEASAAKPGATTWVNPGALRSGAIKEKPLPVLPGALADDGVRDRLHPRFLGREPGAARPAAERPGLDPGVPPQAGGDEHPRHRVQRAAAGRKHIGRVRLYFIQRYLSTAASCGSPGGRPEGHPAPARPDRGRLRRDHRRGALVAEPAAGVWQTFVSGAAIIRGHDHPAGAPRGAALLAVPGQLRRQDARAARDQQQDPQAQQQKQIAMQTALTAIEEKAAGADLKRAQAEHQRSLSTYDRSTRSGAPWRSRTAPADVAGRGPSPEQHRHAAPARRRSVDGRPSRCCRRPPPGRAVPDPRRLLTAGLPMKLVQLRIYSGDPETPARRSTSLRTTSAWWRTAWPIRPPPRCGSRSACRCCWSRARRNAFAAMVDAALMGRPR